MTKKVDSQALGILNKALGLTGAGSPVTELADGVVDQTLDVGPIVRRSRTLGVSEGIFTALLLNEHAGAGTLSNEINPYEAGALARAPFPSPVPQNFDLWLLSATLQRESGTGSQLSALFINHSPSQLAFTRDDGGSAFTDTPLMPVMSWDTLITVSQNNARTAGVSNTGPGHIGIRLPRNIVGIRFVSVASAIADYQCMMTIGMFPVGLGQDGLV